MFSGLKDRQTDRRTDGHACYAQSVSVATANSQTSSSQYVPCIYTHASQRATPNHQHSCRSPCTTSTVCTASALINEIFIHSSHTHTHTLHRYPYILHFHQIVSQTADITWQSKAVFDFTESRFSFTVNPGLDLLTNRMVWIRERGRL